MIKAAKNFDESLGYAFSTYATHLIYGEIKRSNRDTASSFHLSRNESNEYRTLMYYLNKFPDDLEMVLEKSGINKDKYNYYLPILLGNIGLSYKVNFLNRPSELSDIIPDNTDIEGDYLLNERINELLSVLDDDCKTVMLMYYVYGYNQVELSKMLGISQVQISRWLSRAKQAIITRVPITIKRRTSKASKMRELLEKGYNVQQIIAETGFNKDTVRLYRNRWLKQNGGRKAV